MREASCSREYFFLTGLGDDSFLDVVAHHGGGELHPGEAPEAAVDELHGLVEIQPHGGKLPGSAGRENPAAQAVTRRFIS